MGQIFCWTSMIIYGILSLNIIDAFFLWESFQYIKEQTEKAAPLIGQKEHRKRKRYSNGNLFMYFLLLLPEV